MVAVSRSTTDGTYDPAEYDRFTEWLRDRSDWEAATRHRFVEEYRSDDLSDDVFEQARPPVSPCLRDRRLSALLVEEGGLRAILC